MLGMALPSARRRRETGAISTGPTDDDIDSAHLLELRRDSFSDADSRFFWRM